MKKILGINQRYDLFIQCLTCSFSGKNTAHQFCGYNQMERIFKFLENNEQQEMNSSEKSDSSVSDIQVHKYTEFPTKAWECMKVKEKFQTLTPLDPNTPISKDHVRFVCISDTHTRLEGRHELVPQGDVLLHAGDFTQCGSLTEVDAFNKFLGELPHRYKVVIAGNHDLTFDEEFRTIRRQEMECRFRIDAKKYEEFLKKRGFEQAKDVLTNCIYLQDSSVNIYGINIYGSPWQPEFCGWAFNLRRGQECLEKWNLIPDTTDILITHGPPVGHGDATYEKVRAGCVELLTSVQKRIKPAYHIFGHIHEGYGVTTDGQTIFINASTCNLRYRPANPPIVFDYPLPKGYIKDVLEENIADGVTSNTDLTENSPAATRTAANEDDMDCDFISKKLS